MSTPVTIVLKRAAKSLGLSAKALNNNAAPSGLSAEEYECLIGIGLACDWVRWAEQLKAISFSNKKRTNSMRAHTLNEITRFTFMWTATNALFARLAVLELLDPNAISKRSELDKFKVLFNHCTLPVEDCTYIESTLHNILSLPMHVVHFPWPSINTPPTILEVIYSKYTTTKEQNNRFGKKLLNAATYDNYEALDLQTLIYATRNWNIHGALLSSSFRGTPKKFRLWIDSINIVLANVIEGSAIALHKALQVK